MNSIWCDEWKKKKKGNIEANKWIFLIDFIGAAMKHISIISSEFNFGGYYTNKSVKSTQEEIFVWIFFSIYYLYQFLWFCDLCYERKSFNSQRERTKFSIQ